MDQSWTVGMDLYSYKSVRADGMSASGLLQPLDLSWTIGMKVATRTVTWRPDTAAILPHPYMCACVTAEREIAQMGTWADTIRLARWSWNILLQPSQNFSPSRLHFLTGSSCKPGSHQSTSARASSSPHAGRKDFRGLLPPPVATISSSCCDQNHSSCTEPGLHKIDLPAPLLSSQPAITALTGTSCCNEGMCVPS